jgi:hypothetical protein
MCELYCPADAIYVGPDARVPQQVDPAAILASGLLGQMRRDHDWEVAGADPLRDYWQLGPLLMQGAQRSVHAISKAIRNGWHQSGEAGMQRLEHRTCQMSA